MAVRTFKSNPRNRLAYDNEQFKLRLDQIAFTSPSTYFKIKKDFLKSLVEDTIVDIHTTVYNALTDGKKKDNSQIVILGQLPNELQEDGEIEPKIPEEEADQIAMNVAKTLKSIFEKEVVDRIFHTDNIKMALERASRNAELKMA